MVSNVARLSAIHTEIFHCTRCPLHVGRTNTVPGSGDPDAEIMFIGEAPGAVEDEQGLPFVGRSGQYLEELLATINLTRNDVFIANVVKCRPPENRDPTETEMATCHPYLQAQINVIDPLLIVTVGRYSMGLFFPNAKISKIHGQPKYDARRVYYPLYHPAYVLRNRAKLEDEIKRDIARIPQLLDEARHNRQNAPDQPDEPLKPDDEQESVASDDNPTQFSLFD
ncbi:MAG: uracil-DNA glycosylase [Anaerolineae bacterium]